MTTHARRPVPAWLLPKPKRPAPIVAAELREHAKHVEAKDPGFADQLRKRAAELLERANDSQPTNGARP
jgi:hypothetical protein